jgi:hypothetical protein
MLGHARPSLLLSMLLFTAAKGTPVAEEPHGAHNNVTIPLLKARTGSCMSFSSLSQELDIGGTIATKCKAIIAHTHAEFLQDATVPRRGRISIVSNDLTDCRFHSIDAS